MTTVIVDRDTLRAAGLRQILKDRHGIEAVITCNPRELGTYVDEATLFFVTPEAFASMPYYYVPRRERVVLISPVEESPLPVLSPAADEETIMRQIDTSIGRMASVKSAATLSGRERQVLRLIAMGRINKEIAELLGISFNTVLTHRKNIAAKLGIRTPAAMSVYAMMNGIIGASDIDDTPLPANEN